MGKKAAPFQVRLTEEEVIAIKAGAKEAGMTVAEYFRRKVFSGVKAEDVPVPVGGEFVCARDRQLGYTRPRWNCRACLKGGE